MNLFDLLIVAIFLCVFGSEAYDAYAKHAEAMAYIRQGYCRQSPDGDKRFEWVKCPER